MNRHGARPLTVAAALAVLLMTHHTSASDTSASGARNRLATEHSVYLRQHATNPVDWYPWGDEALARARDEGKPVFLSIGYSSCHWCHVMEHEVFEDEAVAAYVNERFVCIKVDREERPDLDAAYMEAVQAMTGRGGWPMSVFLTPELQPFWGGTYVPRDAFMELCRAVDAAWRERRDDVTSQAARLAAAVNRAPHGVPDAAPTDDLNDTVATDLLAAYDDEWGGFRQSNKFPTPLRWRYLLHHARRDGDETALAAVRHTLDAMDSGGIHDHLGGGFHRYTVEPTWLVPHFEIMLYDNAQLAELYLEAARVFDEPRYRTTGLGVLDFLLRDMQDPDGGIYASFDADSGGEEGSFYVWTPEEIATVAGPDDGPDLARLLGVHPGGNFEGHSILTRRIAPADDREAALFDRWREPLRAARADRVWPGLDRKIVTAWNGLTISALARGYALSGDARYLDAAERAAERLWSRHRDDRGRLIRASTDGVPSGDGVLDDYAFLAAGLLDLHLADLAGQHAPQHLERAVALVDTARDLFADTDGDWYLTPADVDAPLGRRLEVFDSVEPSGAAVMARVLARLSALTGDPALAAEADLALAARAGLLAQAPLETGWWADALLLRTAPFYDVVIAGDADAPDTRALIDAYRTLDPIHAVLTLVPSNGPGERLQAATPSAIAKTARDGRATAYVCIQGACQQPVHEPSDLRRQLLEGWTR